MRIITGSTGTTHVTSNDDGEFNQGIFGNGLIVLENGKQLSAAIVDNNTIRVSDGDLVFQGRHALILPNTVEELTIETGTVGENRNDLIVARYVLDSATGYESITLEVLKGEETIGIAVDPEVTAGDIRTGTLLAEVALYRVKIEGVNIVALECLFEVTNSIMALIKMHNENESNPHKVNKTQVGLGNVPNVATNDQTPTFSIATALAALVSGEKLSVSFGKIAKAIAELISHIGNKSNPHGVTKAQVGLGSVDNTADSAKSVKYAATAGSASKADNASYATSAYALSHSIGVTIGRTTKNTTWGAGLSFSLDDIGALPLSGGALSGWLSIPNNSTIYSLTSTGESVRLIDINSSNNMHINNGTVKTDLYLHSSGKQINFNASAFFPNTAKDTMFGTSNKQWGQIYSSNATISTSDRNAKDKIKPLSDIHKQFFMKLIPVSFVFKDGTSGRTHVGFISQDVERAMEELGMSSLDFAGFCKDVKTVDVLDENGDIDHEEVVLDENGNPEYIYSLRYEEFIALIAKVVQDVVHELEDTKKDVAEIKSKLTSIESTLAKVSA